MLVESDERTLRTALMVDGRLAAIEIDHLDRPSRVGAVGPAKVVRIARGLGALVRLRDGTEMLLERGRGQASPSAGDQLQAQVIRAQRGAKLGIASREVRLAGRGLVHLPLGGSVAISRRLDISSERRENLVEALTRRGKGWIVRHSAKSMSEFELMREVDTLEGEGRRVAEPGAALPPPDSFRRLMSDHGAPAPESILVSGRTAERAVGQWSDAFAPDFSLRIETHGRGLFDAYDLETSLAALADSRVPLDDGASLVIERTETLTAIDVNAGGAQNMLSVNLAAAMEIARQMQLRHIGGIIVIDFISMERTRDRTQIAAALKMAVADDPARTDILPMSAFGLIEMTRERRGPELELSR